MDQLLVRPQLTRDTQFPAVGGHLPSRRWGSSSVCYLGFHLPEPVASAVDVHDVAVVQQAIEYGGGEYLVAG